MDDNTKKILKDLGVQIALTFIQMAVFDFVADKFGSWLRRNRKA